eukprot:TRINITY_DN61483_c0_g1_i2.p1 TRINITY_DN61483_c0_g1~~TRINITY_DN61483_c0_g1_i2.p1  ORF type:complete len:228 (+),score=18.29 TRINITY_DN61483_c0_g1_i2:129-812(+)
MVRHPFDPYDGNQPMKQRKRLPEDPVLTLPTTTSRVYQSLVHLLNFREDNQGDLQFSVPQPDSDDGCIDHETQGIKGAVYKNLLDMVKVTEFVCTRAVVWRNSCLSHTDVKPLPTPKDALQTIFQAWDHTNPKYKTKMTVEDIQTHQLTKEVTLKLLWAFQDKLTRLKSFQETPNLVTTAWTTLDSVSRFTEGNEAEQATTVLSAQPVQEWLKRAKIPEFLKGAQVP